ncbi:hypothetical protein [Tropicibacter sp. Alg240-R139]|uniref:hypothetical protein n=1 Tax=Tropicibacter sp. Alg240-R139 TaxID=2305991 RepID=UPI0013DF34CD|nr:hypothetical protein [Tropicibacter sp. Alg240-R139]
MGVLGVPGEFGTHISANYVSASEGQWNKADGRRRGGRRWEGGENKISAEDLKELGEKNVQAIDDDKMFTIVPPRSGL